MTEVDDAGQQRAGRWLRLQGATVAEAIDLAELHVAVDPAGVSAALILVRHRQRIRTRNARRRPLERTDR